MTCARYFLRAVHGALWSKLGSLTPQEINSAAAQLIAAGGDVSVFAVLDEDDPDRIAVALAAGREALSKLDLVEVRREDLVACGLTARATDGATASPEVNVLHAVIDLDLDSAQRLVRQLQGRKAQRVRRSPPDLVSAAKRLTKAGRITIPKNSKLLR